MVAAVGVATVSFACSQGREPRVETTTSGNLLPAPPQEAGFDPVTTGDADTPLPTSGNLVVVPMGAELADAASQEPASAASKKPKPIRAAAQKKPH